MDRFEIGKYLGRIEILLKNIPDSEEEIYRIERALKYNYSIIEIAKVYGRIEQKMFETNNIENLDTLKKLFNEIQQTLISEFKNKNMSDLQTSGIPIKILNDNNIFTVKDLLDKSFDELKCIKGISKRSLEKLEDEIEENGLYIKK